MLVGVVGSPDPDHDPDHDEGMCSSKQCVSWPYKALRPLVARLWQSG